MFFRVLFPIDNGYLDFVVSRVINARAFVSFDTQAAAEFRMT